MRQFHRIQIGYFEQNSPCVDCGQKCIHQILLCAPYFYYLALLICMLEIIKNTGVLEMYH